MLPGNINPRQMKAMMKKLGMQVEQIEDVESI
ncbi:MAG: NAC domain-containing protein, partial [Methanoregula sp.]